MRGFRSSALRRAAPAAGVALAIVFGVARGSAVARNPETPPLGHTGGFGEPTCQACHFESAVNSGSGSVQLLGVDTPMRAGETRTITVAVFDSAVARAGFMLSARTVRGAQAGSLAPRDERATVSSTRGGLHYAHHTETGTALDSVRSARWTLDWTIPEAPGDTVVLHFTVNAANNDSSPLGDLIYADSVVVQLVR